MLATIGAGAAFFAPGAGAQDATPPPIDVIEVKGRIDAIEAEFISRSLKEGERAGVQMIILQLDSPGALVSDARLDALAAEIAAAPFPVAVWVGPSGAEARGGAVRLLEAADLSGSATKAHIGDIGDPDEALRVGLVELVTPTLGDFIVELDGREVAGTVLRTAQVVQRDTPRREPIAQVRFAKLGLIERMLHATTAPWAAYVLFMLGLVLIVFELYSVGIGLAGLTGAGSLVLGAYGLAALDARWPALALLGLATVGFAIDIQAGAARAWTGIATVSLIAGTWLLYPSGLRVPIWIQVVGVFGVVVFMVRAMPSVVRARFSTPTIGREALIGQEAEATTAFDPQGMVRLRGGIWRARATRASKIGAGDTVRVVALDGLVLEVEQVEDAETGPEPS